MMLTQNVNASRKPGRPATGCDPMFAARLPQDVLDALQSVSQTERLNRSETLRFILRDWLTGHGYLRHREDPEGAN